ncbi:MAG: bifunctional nuclease family protein [Acidimicrobiales bacterium]
MTNPAPAESVGATGGAEQWRIVTVSAVELDLPAAYPEVVLTEQAAPWRTLRIPVGLAEGTAIAYALRGVATSRPLTHALVAELLERHGIEVAALRITARRGTVYLAELDTMGPKGHEVLACRPSDGIALVLRRSMATPIVVADALFEDDGELGPSDSG